MLAKSAKETTPSTRFDSDERLDQATTFCHKNQSQYLPKASMPLHSFKMVLRSNPAHQWASGGSGVQSHISFASVMAAHVICFGNSFWGVNPGVCQGITNNQKYRNMPTKMLRSIVDSRGSSHRHSSGVRDTTSILQQQDDANFCEEYLHHLRFGGGGCWWWLSRTWITVGCLRESK